MKYIIIIDNNSQCAATLKALLIKENKKHKNNSYKIGAWIFDASINISGVVNSLCDGLNKILESESDEIHLLVDLLLTQEEENKVSNIADRLVYKNDNPNALIATGISVANSIIERFPQNVHITFMSKWLNLQNIATLDNYNGIYQNKLWENREKKIFLNPVNEDGYIINRSFYFPKDDAKTVVEDAVNMAFRF